MQKCPENGFNECGGKDLLTEFKNLSRALNIPGNQNKNIIKQAIWNKHDKVVKAMLAGKEKVRDILEDNRTQKEIT